MAFQIPKQPYSGKIGTTTIGTGDRAVTLGGADSYPFYLFEGSMPNPPKIAMEIWDYDPSKEWPAAVVEPFKDVIGSPEAWAKKCVEEYGADLIVIQLKSTDPNGINRGADEAAGVVKRVADSVKVPVVLWGTADNQKDEEVLKKIAETCQDRNLGLSPVEEANYKGVGASALAYGQRIVASSPIDVNLAKQLNILLGNLGVGSDKIIIDPTTGGLGYGLEYSYSVMERIRMAALTQEDDKLQIPIIANVGNEVWKCKEAGQPIESAPNLGDPEKRGISMEVTAAVCYLLAGADAVILRHPETVRLIRAYIERMLDGGSMADVQGISKKLKLQEVDLAPLAPEPVLAVGKEETPPAPKPKEKAAAPKAEEKPKAPPKASEKVVELKPEVKGKQEISAKAEAEAKAQAEAEAKKKAEADAKAKAEQEAKAKAEADAKAKAEAEAKAQAEAEAKKKAEADAKAKEKDDLEALRKKRASEKVKVGVEKKVEEVARVEKEIKTAKPPTFEPESVVDRLTRELARMHKHS
ncbi:MAG: acetyl-CoA decarbonylase/synthase complex subunit delta [Deltaproteobacteria bacterium]|nr:acetyl-CoA decarbonylase/synthase complex subunit delta [Deltaproteobacteria bacterium]